jgi:hypothetical protein
MVDDGSVDFVFSFDSLVHAEADVMAVYLEQLSRKLKPHGIGFFHHSNVAAHRRVFSLVERLPPAVRKRGEHAGWLPYDHWRAHSMDAGVFRRLCASAGLACVGQELVNWDSRLLIDSFSVFTPAGSMWERPNRVVRNSAFMKEAAHARRLLPQYCLSGARRPDVVLGGTDLLPMLARKLNTAKRVYRSRGPSGIVGVFRQKASRGSTRG